MKLRELDAHFVGDYRVSEQGTTYRRLRGLSNAQGILFQCPKCAETCERVAPTKHRLGYAKGAHSVLCWFRNPRRATPVPDSAEPGPGRWWVEPFSRSIDDLTFGFGTPPMPKSVLLTGGCGWHGFVENGEAK